jgi:hypothetical protein
MWSFSMCLFHHFAGRSWAVALLGTFAAYAATAPPLSLEGLIDRSPLIVEGSVTNSWTAWDSHHRYIWTHHEVRVNHAIRGSGATVTVSEPGGSLDGVNQAFSGSIGYYPNEHVVLFLFRTPIGYWRTTGGGLGKFTVQSDGRVHSAITDVKTPIARRKGSDLTASEFRTLVGSLAHSRVADEIR